MIGCQSQSVWCFMLSIINQTYRQISCQTIQHLKISAGKPYRLTWRRIKVKWCRTCDSCSERLIWTNVNEHRIHSVPGGDRPRTPVDAIVALFIKHKVEQTSGRSWTHNHDINPSEKQCLLTPCWDHDYFTWLDTGFGKITHLLNFKKQTNVKFNWKTKQKK